MCRARFERSSSSGKTDISFSPALAQRRSAVLPALSVSVPAVSESSQTVIRQSLHAWQTISVKTISQSSGGKLEGTNVEIRKKKGQEPSKRFKRRLLLSAWRCGDEGTAGGYFNRPALPFGIVGSALLETGPSAASSTVGTAASLSSSQSEVSAKAAARPRSPVVNRRSHDGTQHQG